MSHGYTLSDMCAMAEAFGVQYGAIQQHLEFGRPLPPQRKPVAWPSGSAHEGELQMGNSPKPKAEPEREAGNALGFGRRMTQCDFCGRDVLQVDTWKVYAHTNGYQRGGYGRKVAGLCPECAARMLPSRKPEKTMKEVCLDEDGNQLGCKYVARCCNCDGVFAKLTGATMYVQTSAESHPLLRGYFCPECWPVWSRAIKKAAQPD